MNDANISRGVRLGEVVDVLDHLRVPVNSGERAKRRGSIPYYGANGQQGWIDRPLFNEPLVLLAEDGGNFDDFAIRPIAYRISGPSWVNNHAHVIRAIAGVDQDFVFWSLVNKDIRKYIAGGTRSKLTQGELRSIEISLPPLPEQRLIAEILDTVDEAIRKTEAIIAKLGQVKQGLLHDLLTRGIDENGELRDPDRHPEQFKDSPLGRIPRRWQTPAIAEFTTTSSGTTPSRRFPRRYFAGEYPWVKTLDLNENYLSDTQEHITRAAVQECGLTLFPAGAVLVAMYGGWLQIGRTALLQVPAYVNQAISAIVVTDGSARPEFLLRALQHGRYRWKQVAASTRKDPNITKRDVRAFRIAVPPLTEQDAITTTIRQAIEREASEQYELSKLRLLKQGLVDDLLTGRVRVTNLLQEAAK